MSLTVLLDGYSLLYRAYHGLQAPMTAPDGTPTNALHAFMMMLLKILEREQPDRIIAAFDAHAPSFRKELYEGYKAHRSPMPEDLRPQDPIIRELLSLMGIPIVEIPGFEGDDIVGTLSRKATGDGGKCLIVTGDRDSFQLVTDDVSILYTKKGVSDTVQVTPRYILDEYGVTPRQLIDVKSLMGDASDEIPGIRGVGEKTAIKLIQKYGDVEGVLAHAQDEKGALRTKLETGADDARLSRKLAEISLSVPAELPDSRLAPRGAIARLKELGMQVCAAKYASLEVASQEEAAPAPQEEIKYDHTLLTSPASLATAPLAGTVYLAAGDVLSFSSEAGSFALPLGSADLLSPSVELPDALSCLLPRLAGHPLVVFDKKSLSIPGEADDAMLAAYVLSPTRTSFTLASVCADEGIPYCADCPAASLALLWPCLKKGLSERDQGNVYGSIELPLSDVLRSMEIIGFRVEKEALARLKTDFNQKVAHFEAAAIDAIGHPVNLNSPKQLAQVLYDEFGLPVPRGKSRSTDADTLESLRDKCPIVDDILEYRRYKKLESTYVDALLRLADGDSRVHSTFDQTATATGRISSNEPNLQNIPVRTEIGRSIRTAFVPADNCILIDADYSQIELRVLAHISGDEHMCRAFNEGDDIHARTASEVYGIPLESVTKEMRSRSKAVNFGIVYGISDFTLARNTGMRRDEAKQFIARYFENYPGVKAYMDRSVALAKELGYAETMMGRRRYLPELKNSAFQVRAFGERCAMNSPIQGTAADIIKLAMIRVDERLRARGMATRLILQVHDELILEAPLEEADEAEAILRDAMENVAHLAVPLSIDISRGGSWSECK